MKKPHFINREGVSALILAAGSGQRLGGKPKAFLKLGRRTLLERAVEAVSPWAAEVIVGVRREDLSRARTLVRGRAKVIAGGPTRQETVSILCRAASKPLILLHEVARPFVKAQWFKQVLEAGASHGAAVVCCPMESADSVALADGEFLDKPVPRARLVSLQAPLAFHRDTMLKAIQRAAKEHWQLEGTAALIHRAGFKVRLVPCPSANLKVTYPEDLKRLRR